MATTVDIPTFALAEISSRSRDQTPDLVSEDWCASSRHRVEQGRYRSGLASIRRCLMFKLVDDETRRQVKQIEAKRIGVDAVDLDRGRRYVSLNEVASEFLNDVV